MATYSKIVHMTARPLRIRETPEPSPAPSLTDMSTADRSKLVDRVVRDTMRKHGIKDYAFAMKKAFAETKGLKQFYTGRWGK